MDAATGSLVDLSPVLRLAGLAVVIASLPLAWLWLRHRGADARGRLAALTALTLFLTFDLIVFGAFTRLTDSGLGCPDWPGCYGSASPIGADRHIDAAQSAMPTGPVTFTKAWIEMIHRYLAMTVGALIVVMATQSWLIRRQLPHSPWWATATLVWVIVQGLFGKYTVTLKLYPAIVTAHLLGGMLLLGMLAAQHESYRNRALALSPRLSGAAVAVLVLVVAQVALGGWVSTNYAVLACRGFPDCNGAWWPDGMDFMQGFTVLHELGRTAQGDLLPFGALVATHWTHRAFSLIVAAAVVALAGGLVATAQPTPRRFGFMLGALVAAQVASGVSNVVLEWPIVAALAHSAGAAALVLTLTLLIARERLARPVRAVAPSAHARVA